MVHRQETRSQRKGAVGRSLSILAALCVVPWLAAADWPQWRGPHRNGTTDDAAPLRWSATEGVLWKAELPGQGISNPVVVGDRVMVTSADGHQQADLHVVCLDRDSGGELWHRKLWGTAPTLYHAQKSSMASPSPCSDGEHVFAFFAAGDVFCLDLDGNLVWHRSLAAQFGEFENRFAASSSPVLYKDSLIVQCDHYGESYVIALDKKTGRERWKADRPQAWLSWSSPQLVEAQGGKTELVVCGSHKVEAYDADTGEHLWRLSGMERECIPTPIASGGRLFVVSGPKGRNMRVRPGGRGDIDQTHVEWSVVRGSPFVPSGIVVGDYYYLVDDAGIATCLRTADGERVWQKRLGGAFTASPVAAGDRVYFVNEEGETIVVWAGKDEYVELARNRIDEPVFASPAISSGRFFLRTARNLYCVGVPPSSGPRP
ncbi:MAG: PQQ-binding-like beta-propeller repeat protein [Planctomycetia bacterium]|nr:PQQ-binding-like beta-propeller repeat protein [Planctomycetia bacterium]